MGDSIIGKALWRAAENTEFRRRALRDLGMALAEEGFILTDAEMALLRSLWEPLHGLDERRSYERVQALARSYPRDR